MFNLQTKWVLTPCFNVCLIDIKQILAENVNTSLSIIDYSSFNFPLYFRFTSESFNEAMKADEPTWGRRTDTSPKLSKWSCKARTCSRWSQIGFKFKENMFCEIVIFRWLLSFSTKKYDHWILGINATSILLSWSRDIFIANFFFLMIVVSSEAPTLCSCVSLKEWSSTWLKADSKLDRQRSITATFFLFKTRKLNEFVCEC